MGEVKSLNPTYEEEMYFISITAVLKIEDLQFFYRGDFPVMLGKQDSTLDVFKLLETACLDLAVVSLKWRLEEGRLAEHLVYKRIVWGMLLVL